GGLLARTDNSTINPTYAFYHADGNGNVTCLINGNQNVVAKYIYDPFGNTLSKSGPLSDANTYRFSSKEIHPNTGFYYYGYRFFDPNTQRWLNRDRIGEEGDINLYAFAFGDPIDWIDDDGLKPLPCPTIGEYIKNNKKCD